MRGHVVRNVSLNPRRSVDHTMIQQMPVDKSLPEAGPNLSWKQHLSTIRVHTLLGGTQQWTTDLCKGVCAVEKNGKHGSLSVCLPEHMSL